MLSLLSKKHFESLDICNEVKDFLKYIRGSGNEISDIAIVLFGSQARETAKITSDIDLAIIGQSDLTKEERFKIVELLENYQKPMNYQLFFTCYSNLTTNNYFDANYHIKKEGVLIYGE